MTEEQAQPSEKTEKKKSALRRLGSGMGRLTRARKQFDMPKGESGLKVVIATDAWKPQLNGVVRTLDTLGKILTDFGNEVLYITPNEFRSVPLPSYPEIRLSLLPNRKVAKLINDFQPDAIHIATEGPIGRATRRFCKRRGYPFTTSFHTRFAEYANERWKVPTHWGYSILKDFHKDGETMMVATPGLVEELTERGFSKMKLWARGVDLEQFQPGDRSFLDSHERPIFLYVGRLAVEKSIEDFLEADLPGTKLIVGDGPQKEELEAKYPDAVFTGPKYGDELTKYYQASDVFVFPSRTDTFGLVNVEALACGVPVAAYPVRGPLEILDGAPAGCGAMNEDLTKACLTAYEKRNPEECRAWAENFSWEAASRQFIVNLETPGFDEQFWLRSAKMID
ncbi:glycosyltransferase family 1 protein [Hyphococcus flavus]|uniref:Glycosyltransferase family 1 protein n=1 Tax=Hyphococcus flavus TaxID=1866326 RepID=A0AAF0CGG4_9PROT|nr:glycosyltransferase family 1 protein [Hyphococcus flavus]WDI32339.1 glycosyltransferase family 1 protein [Hyphococcus flavus]